MMPMMLAASTKLSDAEELMRSKKISAVVVTGERGGDEGVCGVLEQCRSIKPSL